MKRRPVLPIDGHLFPRGSLNLSEVPAVPTVQSEKPVITVSASQPEKPNHDLNASLRHASLKFPKLAQAEPDAKPIDLDTSPKSDAVFFEDSPVLSLLLQKV